MKDNPKYLIFASNGPKPEIGFKDAVSNSIVILKNESSCLVYNHPIVRSDRELHLLVYDVYRFAGIELNSKEKARGVVENFFRQLFAKRGINQS